MPRENHPSFQPHLDHGAIWGPSSSETHDHRHWFSASWRAGRFPIEASFAWTDTELNRPVAVIEALAQAGR